MKVGQFTVRAAIMLALSAMLGLGLLSAGTARAADNAFVRFVHAAPFNEHVDVFVNNGAQPLLTGFTFSNVSDYIPLPAGSLTIQVAPTGQGKGNSALTQTITVQAGASYTVALIGDTTASAGLVQFTDGSSVPTDKSVLRVYNLSSDAGAISVSSAGTTVISSLPFKSASSYLTFNPNQSIFQVTVPGDKNNPHQTLDASFEPNRISSVFALGLTTIVDSLGFKFVTKLTAAVPTALPTTGFAPQSSSDNGMPSSVVYALGGLAALSLLGGTRFALGRHRRNKVLRPTPPTAVHSR